MIVAQQMQRSVYQQAGDLAIYTPVRPASLPSRGFEADDDVAQHPPASIRIGPLPQGESKNVGRAGAGAIARVQFPNGGVVDQGDGELGAALRQLAQHSNGAGTEQTSVDGGKVVSGRRAVQENRHFAERSRSPGPPRRVRSP